MGFVQRMHLDPAEKLDLYRDLRGTSAKEERFTRDLRVLEYLNGAPPPPSHMCPLACDPHPHAAGRVLQEADGGAQGGGGDLG
jgi:hypothetical protein